MPWSPQLGWPTHYLDALSEELGPDTVLTVVLDDPIIA